MKTITTKDKTATMTVGRQVVNGQEVGLEVREGGKVEYYAPHQWLHLIGYGVSVWCVWKKRNAAVLNRMRVYPWAR